MTYDPLLHHRRTTRFQDRDYAGGGSFFVTLVVHDRRHLFGEVRDGKMCLSPAGLIADNLWLKIPELHAHARLDAHVVMPDHMHGILILAPSPAISRDNAPPRPGLVAPSPRDTQAIGKRKVAIAPRSGSLGAIIGAYKAAVTKAVRALHQMPTGSTGKDEVPPRPAIALPPRPGIALPSRPDVALYNGPTLQHDQKLWLERYYESVLTHPIAVGKVRQYIIDNPLRWSQRSG